MKMNCPIKFYIFNYKQDKNAQRWYDLISPFFACEVYDCGNSSYSQFKKFPNIYYAGLFNEVKKDVEQNNTEWAGVICSDVTITDDNAKTFLNKVKWLTTTKNVGQYAPSCDNSSALRNRKQDLSFKLQSVNFIEGMFFIIRTDYIKKIPLIDAQNLPHGLYIDNVLSAMVINDGKLNIFDNSWTIHHPEESGYSKNDRGVYQKWCLDTKQKLFNTAVSLDNLNGLNFSPSDNPIIKYSINPTEIIARNPYVALICERADGTDIEPIYSTKERFIITMTTWPKRIENLPIVLNTLLDGDELPDFININVCTEEFPLYEKSFPEEVRQYIESHKNIIRLNWLKNNTKVWKKAIPTLLQYPNDCIISVDDDFYYPKDFLKTFKEKYKSKKTPLSGAHTVNRFFHRQLQHCGTASLDRFEWLGKYLCNLNEECFEKCGDDDFFTYCLYAQKIEEVYVGKHYNVNMTAITTTNSFSKEKQFKREEITKFLDTLPLNCDRFDIHHHSERINNVGGWDLIPVYVSLTSWKDRLSTLPEVIESIKKQALKIDKCFLWLSKEEVKLADIPQEILKNNFVEIKWVDENLKSFKKFLTIEQCPNAYNIIIDDDRIYEPSILENLWNFMLTTPKDGPCCFYCDKCNSKGQPWGEVERDDCGKRWVNDSCIIYPPYSFPQEVFFYFDTIMHNEPLVSDECFIMPFIIKNEIQIYALNEGLNGLSTLEKRAPTIKGTEKSALHTKFYSSINKNITTQNRKNELIKRIIRQLPSVFYEKWKMAFKNFFLDFKHMNIYTTYYKDEQKKQIANNSIVIPYNVNNEEFASNTLNKYWSEFIVMKNIWQKGKTCDYIGFDQYDTHFPYDVLPELLENGYVINYAKCALSSTVYTQFRNCHTDTELHAAIGIIDNIYGVNNPYSNYLKNGKIFYYKSCFAMSWENFDKMSKFIFTILDNLDKKYNLNFNTENYYKLYNERIKQGLYKNTAGNSFESQRRGFGFLAERLISAWLYVNIPSGRILTIKDGNYRKHLTKPMPQSSTSQIPITVVDPEMHTNIPPKKKYTSNVIVKKKAFRRIESLYNRY